MDHIAFIMDGNGRWAECHKKNRQHGHEIGSSNVYNIFLSCVELGVRTATFFAMSSENMSRSKQEIDYISTLLESSIKHHLNDLLANKVRFKVIGDLEHLSSTIKETVNHAEHVTSKFDKYKLNIAYNYGGQWDVVNAIKTLLSDKKEISALNISKYLSTGSDYPDLIVRTGGYRRLSNFMLWQAAYSELIFTDTLWPDFTEQHVKDIFFDYKLIKRKFGKVD